MRHLQVGLVAADSSFLISRQKVVQTANRKTLKGPCCLQFFDWLNSTKRVYFLKYEISFQIGIFLSTNCMIDDAQTHNL